MKAEWLQGVQGVSVKQVFIIFFVIYWLENYLYCSNYMNAKFLNCLRFLFGTSRGVKQVPVDETHYDGVKWFIKLRGFNENVNKKGLSERLLYQESINKSSLKQHQGNDWKWKTLNWRTSLSFVSFYYMLALLFVDFYSIPNIY